MSVFGHFEWCCQVVLCLWCGEEGQCQPAVELSSARGGNGSSCVFLCLADISVYCATIAIIVRKVKLACSFVFVYLSVSSSKHSGLLTALLEQLLLDLQTYNGWSADSQDTLHLIEASCLCCMIAMKFCRQCF